MIQLETAREKTNEAKTPQDIERLDRVADALAFQALGCSQMYAEQFKLETDYLEDDGDTIVRSNN